MSRGGLSSSDVRAHNLGLLLTTLDEAGALSRTEIAQRTGMTAGAITALTTELVSMRLVRTVDGSSDAPEVARRGRPRELVEVDGSALALVGLQIELDVALVEVVDLAGRVLLRRELDVRTPVGDPETLLAVLGAAVARAAREVAVAGATPIALAVTVPAPILHDSTIVPLAIDLGWEGVDVAALLRHHLPELPLGIRVDNDANCAAYAEYATVRAELPDVADVIYIKSDTGIGGGAVVAGRVLEGSRGFAFEPGHVIVDPTGSLCRCGQRGCLVTVADPAVVLARAGLSVATARHGVPYALRELMDAVHRGDRDATAAVDDMLGSLRVAITNCIVLFRPAVVVLGGYLAELVDRMGPLPIRPDGDAIGADVAPVVRPARRGAFAGVDGLLLRVRHELLAAPHLLPPTATIF